MRWDEWGSTAPDDEFTELSNAAHSVTLALADATFESRYDSAVNGAELRIRYEGAEEPIVVVVRGQSSVTGHGKHGAHPSRVAEWRTLPEAVLFLAVEGGAHVGYYVWLDRDEPPVRSIKDVPAADPSARQGWLCSEMRKVALDARGVEDVRHGAQLPRFEFPRFAPPRTEPGLFAIKEEV